MHVFPLPLPIPPIAIAVPSPAAGIDLEFLWRHLALPLAVSLVLSMVLIGFGGDFWLADRVYALQGHAWTLRSHHITEVLIHRDGKTLTAAAWLLVLAAWGWSCVGTRLRRWRRPLGYLAITTLLACLAVSGLKSVTAMDCPWDLQRYGGSQPFVGLFQQRPVLMPAAACFPAGHASAGYGWVTLYFFFLATRPALRWAGLAAALAIGLTFGVSQQLRGAHFLSHDVWTLIICWLVALGGYLLLKPVMKGTAR